VEGGGFLMNRTNRPAFSGASPLPVVEHTRMSACFLMSPSSVVGGWTHDSMSFFRLNMFISMTSAEENDEEEAALDIPLADSLIVLPRSLAMCSALPVAEP